MAADEVVGRNGEPDKHRSTEWTEELKTRLVEIDDKERQHGRGFMMRTKQRWEVENPNLKIIKQLLRDNTKRFRDEKMAERNKMTAAEEIKEMFANSMELGGFEGSSSGDEQKEKEEQQWDNDQNVFLIMLDEMERREGCGFMKRMKERRDEVYPQTPHTTQNLRDNASRFKKEKELTNLAEVRTQFYRQLSRRDDEEEVIGIVKQKFVSKGKN